MPSYMPLLIFKAKTRDRNPKADRSRWTQGLDCVCFFQIAASLFCQKITQHTLGEFETGWNGKGCRVWHPGKRNRKWTLQHLSQKSHHSFLLPQESPLLLCNELVDVRRIYLLPLEIRFWLIHPTFKILGLSVLVISKYQSFELG